MRSAGAEELDTLQSPVDITLERALEYIGPDAVSYTHLRAHETGRNLVCRLLLEKKMG